MEINKIDIDKMINYDKNEDMDSILSIPKQDDGKYRKIKNEKNQTKKI
jgi:hypothetical protein